MNVNADTQVYTPVTEHNLRSRLSLKAIKVSKSKIEDPPAHRDMHACMHAGRLWTLQSVQVQPSAPAFEFAKTLQKRKHYKNATRAYRILDFLIVRNAAVCLAV